MHWVERGPEPDSLEGIRLRYTPRWTDFYNRGIGSRPSDSRWIDFKPDLMRVFSHLCAYCEAACNGDVDHFRPKSRFPELVYEWSNWLISCRECDHAKGYKWPARGYVDPCAKSSSARPEHFFDFDTRTGEIVPKEGLSPTRRRKAQTMISDLCLNGHHHLKKRFERLYLLDTIHKAVPAGVHDQSPDLQRIRAHLSSRATQFSSVARAWLTKRGHLPEE